VEVGAFPQLVGVHLAWVGDSWNLEYYRKGAVQLKKEGEEVETVTWQDETFYKIGVA